MAFPDASAADAAGNAPERAASNWNIPNLITVVRILLAPLFMWMLLADNGTDSWLRWAAGVLFIVAIATDGVDGAIARRRNLVTELGKLLDPIADKVLTGAALVSLSILGELPGWVTVLILVREIGITAFRFVKLRDGVIAASHGGKLKTTMQGVAISFALMPFWIVFGTWVYWLDGVLMTIAVILTVVTGLEYLWHAWWANRAGRG